MPIPGRYPAPDNGGDRACRGGKEQSGGREGPRARDAGRRDNRGWQDPGEKHKDRRTAESARQPPACRGGRQRQRAGPQHGNVERQNATQQQQPGGVPWMQREVPEIDRDRIDEPIDEHCKEHDEERDGCTRKELRKRKPQHRLDWRTPCAAVMQVQLRYGT
jgi:hypothetical protein